MVARRVMIRRHGWYSDADTSDTIAFLYTGQLIFMIHLYTIEINVY